MKFELLHQNAQINERFAHESSFVKKTGRLAPCRFCNSLTRWKEVLCQVPVCSQECATHTFQDYRNFCVSAGKKNVDEHFEQILTELKIAERTTPVSTDILIVVKDQVKYLTECIESIEQTTLDYNLYIWDNNSKSETRNYIKNLEQCHPEKIHVVYHDKNIGFVVPNNRLVAMGSGEYIILLNSDCKVYEFWQQMMIGFLQEHTDVAQVGFWGGHVGLDGRGFGGSNGYDIDYIPGWCFCISRDTYNEFGLFDEEHLDFAYCEDLDFSLRLKTAGKKLYALHSPSVHHYQNMTIKEVWQEGQIDVQSTFLRNHAYIAEHWRDYLTTQRVSLKNP